MPLGRSTLCSAVLITAVVIGCTGEEDTSQDGDGARSLVRASPEEALSDVENDFLMAEGTRVVFEVHSEGAFSASLEGHLSLGEGNALVLDASGTFGGDSVSLWLDATHDPMSWGNTAERHEDTRPDGLREAVVIGFVRMGVLHNLARLTSGAPPDHMDGTVRSWVQVADPEWATDDSQAAEAGISFEIRVEDQRAGAATVWLDSAGAMVRREQLVEFPGGEMRVSERYRWESDPSRDR